jgi:hypothetical protein
MKSFDLKHTRFKVKGKVGLKFVVFLPRHEDCRGHREAS